MAPLNYINDFDIDKFCCFVVAVDKNCLFSILSLIAVDIYSFVICLFYERSYNITICQFGLIHFLRPRQR